MKIKYEFLIGQIVEIEVSDEFNEVLIAIEKDVYNSNHRETRRHNSIAGMEDKGVQFYDKGMDIPGLIEQLEISKSLHNALDKLMPQQKRLVQKVFFQGVSIVQAARDEGVNESAIRNRLRKIYKRLKNILD